MANKFLEGESVKKLIPWAWLAALVGFFLFYSEKAKSQGVEMTALLETDIKNTVADPIAKIKAKSSEIIIAAILFIISGAILKSKLPPLVKLGGLVAVFYYGGQYVGKAIDPPNGATSINGRVITITRGAPLITASGAGKNPYSEY